MEIVNKHAKKLKTRGAAWKLHAELIAFEGTPEEVDAYCKKRVTEEGGDKPNQKGVRVGRAIDGLRTISITDTQRKITDLEKTLDAAIASEDHPRSEALLEPSGTLSKATVPVSSSLGTARLSLSAWMMPQKSPAVPVKKSSLRSPTAPP